MEKQYKPSKKRLDKARREGNIPKSQYLSQSIGLLSGLLLCLFYLSNSWVEQRILIEYIWTEGFKAPGQVVSIIASKYFFLTLKLLLIIALTNMAAEAFQAGLFMEPSLLAFKFERADPISGLKKLFGNLKNSWLVVLKFSVIASAIAWFFYVLLGRSVIPVFLPAGPAAEVMYGMILKLTCLLGGLMLALAFLDYYLQRRKWFKNVGMSFEELRRESKDDEGDPLIKSIRRHQHRELLQQDLVRRIRAARVILAERVS